MRRFAGPVALGFALLSLACAGARPVDAAAEEKAIRDIDTSWNAWLIAKNDSAIGAIYADGAVLLPPNLPRMTGAANIRAFWAGLWAMNASLTLTPGTIKVASATLAVEEGSYAFSAPGVPNDAGKYLVVWEKTGGRWQATADIWNSDQPAAPAPAPAPAP